MHSIKKIVTTILFFIFLLVCLNFGRNIEFVRAAAISTSVIRENCSGYSNCYTSLSQWEAARQRDLVAANEIEEARIEGTWTNPDTTPVIIDGWITGPNNYIKIYTAPEARHKGKWGEGYRLSGSNMYMLIKEEYARIDGLSMQTAVTGNSPYFINGSTGVGEIQISNCFGWLTNTASNRDVFDIFSVGNLKIKMWNNIGITDSTSATSEAFYFNDADATAYCYNCTGIANAGRAFRQNAGNVIIKNSLGFSASGAAFAGAFSSVDYSASNDASVDDWGGVDNKISQTFLFVDSINKDFHLSSADAAAINQGTDLSNDMEIPFNTDADGETRTGVWDIGADEYSGSIPPALPENCVYNYSGWSSCQSNNTQTRTVISSSPVSCSGTPALTQSCAYVPPLNNCVYTYSEWSACQSNNTQTRTITSSSPQGCVGTPALNQSCVYTPANPTSKIYYISPTGTDNPQCGQANPCATFAYVFTNIMSGGDTLYVMDGTYNQEVNGMPSGSAGNYTKIYALNDHKVDIDGQGILPANNQNSLLTVNGKSYVEIRGLKVHHSYGSVCRIENSNNITFRVMGCWQAGSTYKHTKPIYVGTSSDVLLEDVWAFGRGRYSIHIADGTDRVVVRRAVTRWDIGGDASEPISGFTIYKGQNSIIENGITLDHKSSADVSTEHYGFSVSSWNPLLQEAINNKIIGSIAINIANATYGAFFTATHKDDLPDNNLWENDVAVDGKRGFQIQAGNYDTIKNCSSLNNNDEGFRLNLDGTNAYYFNNISANNVNYGFNKNGGTDLKFNYNGYNGNGTNLRGFVCTTGCRIDDPQIKYPVRVESTSPHKATGENGADIGANILYKYENGILTNQPLWPWPYESWIKEDMCDPAFLQEIGRTRADTPNWCTSNKTLTQYIWEYLGNPMPSYNEIYGSTFPPPPTCTYSYSFWSSCQSNSAQTRTVTSSSPAGCVGTPALTQSCTYIAPDTTPPTISTPNVSSLTTNSATITFTTNENSNCYLQYGLTASYGQQTPTISNSTNFSIALSNLSDNTIYNYRIISTDLLNNTSQSINYAFKTNQALIPDLTPPAAITNLSAANITQTSAKLSWTAPGDDGNTGIAANYDIRYSTSPIIETNWNAATQVNGEPNPSSSGSEDYISVGLSPNTTYYFAIKSSDEANNISAISNTISFKTLSNNTTVPPPTTTPNPQTPSGNGGGGGGGGGGSAPANTYSDPTPPARPSNFQAQGADKQISLSWVNPPDADFVRVKIIRTESQTSQEPICPTSSSDPKAKTIYEGSKAEYSDINLDNNKKYCYAIFSYDQKPNYSEITAKIAKPEANIKSTAVEKNEETAIASCFQYAQTTSLINVSGSETNTIAICEANPVYSRSQKVELSKEEIAIYDKLKNKISQLSRLNTMEKYSIAHFIREGTPTTKKLGAGERAGVIGSYFQAFNKLPKTLEGWSDVIKIANGRWPKEISKPAEDKAKNEFKKIYKREASMKNPNDNAAVSIIAYGLRPAKRNTASEKKAINSFKAIYKKSPLSALDWDAVRAIAYSGAGR